MVFKKIEIHDKGVLVLLLQSCIALARVLES